MRARVTTILSSPYICIYWDVFKVLYVNSREAVKMNPNWKDVKGVFLSIGTIRQPTGLDGRKGNLPGETRQRSGKELKLFCKRNGSFEKLRTGQGGSWWWELDPESQAYGHIPSGTGYHPELGKFSLAHQWMAPSISAWMNLSFSGSFISLVYSTQNCRGVRRRTDFQASLPPSEAAASVFFSPTPSNKRELH